MYHFDQCKLIDIICDIFAHILEFPTDYNIYTVDLVIFACLNFREFLILGLYKKFRIREFSFLFSSAIIIIISAKFLNSRVCPPREIREK